MKFFYIFLKKYVYLKYLLDFDPLFFDFITLF